MPTFPLTPATLALLGAAGLFAGFVDSIAGGGGIITLPALLAAGLPPHLALGTNKLQSSFGSLTAMLHYRHGGLVSVRRTVLGIVWTFIGAAAGTLAIQRMSPGLLRHVIPALLLAIFVYMLVSPRVGVEARHARLRPAVFYLLFGLAIGFYDGFFGPGTGSFWAIAFVALLGLDLAAATAHTKVMNFVSNATALLFFALGGNVVLVPGLVMGAGEVVGAFAGSRLVMLRGARFVRVFFLVVVALTLARLVQTTYLGPGP
jgi:uncharacterized membrane protein YfcA